MTKGLYFKSGGILTTIQDSGRMGHGQFGITPSGAMDKLSLNLANILLGNHMNEACLEITLFGPHILFKEPCLIALTGGDLGAKINNRKAPMNTTLYINSGDELKFTGKKRGMRTYLSVRGGFHIDTVLGSKSTYIKGSFGGFNGRKIEAGDTLTLKSSSSTEDIGVNVTPNDISDFIFSKDPIRVILGPEDDRFTEKGINTFLTETYSITNQSDRMGYRLNGTKIEHKNGADIISGGITMGAIQIPGHGEPIIMMADRQPTGGYTKIANVISVDLPRLAQLGPGDTISFEKVDVNLAQKLLKKRTEKLLSIQKYFRENTYTEYTHKKQFIIGVNGKSYNVGIMSKK